MTEFVFVINKLLSVATVVAQLFVIFLGFSIFLKWPKENAIIHFVRKNALLLAFLVALSGMLGSLFYSEIAHFEPCSLCWWGRIFLYPQVLILGVAAWKKRKDIEDFILPLSGLGVLVSAYHTYLQYGGSSILPCSASGVSCAQRFVFEFGYLTLPLMGFTSFVLIFLIILIDRKR